MQRGRWWKILGLAGAMGVAATGAIVVRSERARRAYTPDEVREQLHARYTQAYLRDAHTPEVELLPAKTPWYARLRERCVNKFTRS
ncbi:MAG: hypothetical protein GX542_14190 [Rhodococcus sp.]|nr:hypothetical protein [Rhodococcus sp. (in: high G+C Gram-positive bacteria)]